MAKPFRRVVDIASWVSLVLTLLGVGLVIVWSPFGHMDEQGRLHDHYLQVTVAAGAFFCGVLGLVATKILSALLFWLERRPVVDTAEKSGT